MAICSTQLAAASNRPHEKRWLGLSRPSRCRLCFGVQF
jgi:hypothetical protein